MANGSDGRPLLLSQQQTDVQQQLLQQQDEEEDEEQQPLHQQQEETQDQRQQQNQEQQQQQSGEKLTKTFSLPLVQPLTATVVQSHPQQPQQSSNAAVLSESEEQV